MRALVCAIALMVPVCGFAQDRDATLADMRLQLRALASEMAALRAELEPTGAALSVSTGSALERLDGMETELRRLTARTEELEYRIDRIVEDGTNRLGDLEFRLVELEGGDLGAVGQQPALGGEVVQAPDVMVPPVPVAELAIGEQSDFAEAKAKLDGGDPAGALSGFDTFLQSYPRSPLEPAVHLARAQALTGLGRKGDAGRAYLEAFTQAETTSAPVASAALLGLGQTLNDLGQTREACLTLGQVGARFPDQPASGAAETLLAELSCP